MWLYNRDKAIRELEQAYYANVKDTVREVVLDLFRTDALTQEERDVLEAHLVVGPSRDDDSPRDDDTAGLADALRNVIESRAPDYLTERFAEECDSAVTYTADAALMLLISQNDEAYKDVDPDGTAEFRAAMAFEADLREATANDHTMADIAREVLALAVR